MYKVTNVYTICAFAAIGGGLFGFDISSMSGVLGTKAYQRYFDNPLGYRQGGITCAMPAGSFLGALVSSFIADRYSRKVSIQIACVIWVIGAIIQTACNGVGSLVAGRVIAGISVGITSSIVPVYQSEISPKEIRGRIVSLQQWAITWGILIQYFIQYGASFTGGGPKNPNQGTAAFRIPWGVQMVPAIILFCGLFFFPKSPRWLASKDCWEEAVRVLADLHANGDTNHPKVLAEYQEIEEAIRFDREEAASSFAQLTEPRILKRVVLGMSIQMWSQLCGMNIMNPSEIFPSKVRAKAVSLATASNWAWNCALAFAVPPLLRNINWKMYMIFGSFNGAALIHMFLTAPETKGRTLEEMDEVFDSGIPAWRKVPVASRLDRLQKDIEIGNLKIVAPTSSSSPAAAADHTTAVAHSEPLSDQKI
ncbi:hypothetical protein GP486_004872 [Trichoglossum hirsutum]|uniref:Major facilitator superfamily (MFS) profile domain-containing protein n=1 Tax=Trichoglossum hirsutum TaxID=265104 RepID=A0A9P8RNA3_9PEZI|nr:hypothetical protein GP486_004872 [Trichoglossum hirsutum]